MFLQLTDDCPTESGSANKLSFCHPSFNHHSFNPHDSEGILESMMNGMWNSPGTALMMPVHTDGYKTFIHHCNESFDMTSDISKHRQSLKNIKDEKNRFFMETTNNNYVQKFGLSKTESNDSNDKGVGENKSTMLKWRLLTAQENNLFWQTLLSEMEGINFFDVDDRERFCLKYNENNTSTPISNDKTVGMKGYINFMINFQKVIKIRFGIIDGLHRLSVYMQYMESFCKDNTEDKLPHMIQVNVVIVNVVYDDTSMEKGQDFYADLIETVKKESKEVCVNNNRLKNISCTDIINNLISEYETKFNGLTIDATIKQWNTGTLKNDKMTVWPQNFLYDFRQLAIYQFVTGYNYMMYFLVSSDARSLSEPFNTECINIQQYVKVNSISSLSLPSMDSEYKTIAYSLYKRVFGHKVPTFDQFSCTEIWTIPKSTERGSSDAVKFRQAFRIDSNNTPRLYNVEKDWINSDRAGDAIKDFEVFKKQIGETWKKEKSPFFELLKGKRKGDKVKVFSCGPWLKCASTSVTMIQTSKMIHNNPKLKDLWNKMITLKHVPTYDQLVSGSPTYLSGNDIGSITTIATMISNLMFGSFLPFLNKLPNDTARPKKYSKNSVYAIDDVIVGSNTKKKSERDKHLKYFNVLKPLLKDQLCAYMMYQFFEAYSKFGSNPDIVKDMTDKHGIYACQFLLEFRSDGCTDDNTNISHIKEHVKALFEDEEPLKFDEVNTGLEHLQKMLGNVREMFNHKSPMQPTIFGSLLLMYYKWLHNACAKGDLTEFRFNDNVTRFLLRPKKFWEQEGNEDVFKNISDSNFLGDDYSFNKFYEQLKGKDDVQYLDAFSPLPVDDMVENGKNDLCLLHERFLMVLHRTRSSNTLFHRQIKVFLPHRANLEAEKNDLINSGHVDSETRITDIEGEIGRLNQEVQYFLGISAIFYKAAKERYDVQGSLIDRKAVFNLTGKSNLALYLCAYVVLYIGNSFLCLKNMISKKQRIS